MTAVQLTQDDLARVEAIQSTVPGYSGPHHYAFFKGVLEQFTHIKSILVLGVYHGRDMHFIADIATRLNPGREIVLSGVDKFSDTPCADWPEEKRNLSWGEAGYGKPPAPKDRVAIRLLADFGLHAESLRIFVSEMDDGEYLLKTHRQFDFIYLDTAHDEATVSRQLQQVKRVCVGPDTIIAGDDYSNEGTWGVRTAVAKGFTSHEVFAEWIWISNAARLKS
jgi:hypothetical protein